MRLKTTAQSLLSELQYFPGRRHLLVETNQIHADALAEVCGAHPHWTYCMRAVGPKNATLFFDGSDPLGGHGSEVSHTPDYKPFPVSPPGSSSRRESVTAALPGQTECARHRDPKF